MIAHDGNEDWELRLLCGSNSYDDSPFAVMRHGGGSFPGWWKQGCCPQRHQRVVPKSIEGALLMRGEVWHLPVAVYVRAKILSVEQCLDIVLSEMGGQTKP
jgi:hypothetical protein